MILELLREISKYKNNKWISITFTLNPAVETSHQNFTINCSWIKYDFNISPNN